ncbi:hypothetical protein [Bacteriophage Eos]|nr:hypothetical protein [Bacteriophage Eos]
MSKRTTFATGPERTFVKTWEGWDGDGLDWMYFYDCELQPEILKDCVDKGYSPTTQFNLELCLNDHTAQILAVDEEGNDVTVMDYALAVTIVAKS